MLAYMSSKLINFASACGSSPVNRFDDKMLQKNNDYINAVTADEIQKSWTNLNN